MNFRDYLFAQRAFLTFSFLFFVSSAIFGFWGAKFYPDRFLQILAILRVSYGEVMSLPNYQQFLFVLLNNSLVLFLILVFAVFFGIFPLLVLLSNGLILGSLIFFLKDSLPLSLLLTAVFPHGILELPVLIIGCSAGLKIGKKTLDIILARDSGLRREMLLALKIFLRFLFPLLILAGFIEIYLVPIFLKKLI